MAVGTTRGKRKLGALMEGYLAQSGIKADKVIKEVRTSRSTWNRMIAGEARPRWATFIAILAVMKVSDEDRERAVALWEVADDEAVPIKHANALAKNYLRFRRDETEAVAERLADAVLIPGMFQTAEYAAALASGSRLLVSAEDWHEQIVPERLDRQGLLRREPNPLVVHALIDEAALRRDIGGPEVMRAQYDHLLRLAKMPNVTIQAIRTGLGAYGAFAGNFVILDFADDLGSVYFETLTGGVSVEDEEGVGKVRAVWDDMATHALSTEETVEFVRAMRGS